VRTGERVDQMPTYSHSKLETFENCPMRYKLQYIDKVEVEEFESIEAFLGSIVHETLEKLYQDVQMTRIPAADEVIQFFDDPWDERWHLVTYSIPESKRRLRRRLRRRLLWLGFGSLNHATWISPRDLRTEVKQVVDALHVRPYVEFFTAEHRGFASDEEIVARCWNLEQLNGYYAALIARYEPPFQEHQARLTAGDSLEPQECFAQRFMLIHEYRFSPYVDPNLPLELLPDDWLGERATQLFQQYHDLLVEGAEAFVDSVLAKAPERS